MMAIIIVRVRLNGAVTKRKGRALASRGAVFEFHVVAMSLEELAQSLL